MPISCLYYYHHHHHENLKFFSVEKCLYFYFILFYFTYFLSFVLSGPHLPHMEIPRLGVQSELQLPAYATRATATPDPNCICDLHHRSQQRRILNPLSKARDRTCNPMVPSRTRFHCTTLGTPNVYIFKLF